MQTDQIGMDLLPLADERLHKCGTDLAAEQTACLQSAPLVSASAGFIDCTISATNDVKANG